MKRIVTLCMACIMLRGSVLAISAAGFAGAGSGLSGSDAGMVSQEIASSEGDVSDIGNTARTGDVQNGIGMTDGAMNGESSADIPSETGEIGSESTDPGENSTADSDNSADSTQSGSSDQDSGVSWFSVILAIVIVAAIAALIVALLPRRNRM